MSGASTLTMLRVGLHRNGYHPVPVSDPNPMLSNGGKAPFMRGWQQRCALADEAEVASWTAGQRNHGNTGILCGEVSGVDLDVPVAALAAELGALADKMLGTTPLHRIGRAPKSLRCYRAASPMTKMETPELLLDDGTKLQIEALGIGQQFVAYGIHPGTGQPYTWPESGPDVVPLAELPIATEEQLRAFLVAAEAAMREAGGRTEKERQRDQVEPDGPLGDDPPPYEEPAAEPRGTKPFGDKNAFFREVNRRALGDIQMWFCALFPKARKEENTGCWRVSSEDLGRGLEEDISFHPTEGGRDFGAEESCSAIDLVMAWGGAPKPLDAAFYLCEKMGLAPADLGFKPKREKGERPKPADDDCEAIQVTAGKLREAIDAGEAALIASQQGIFQRSTFIVRPGVVRIAVADGRKVNGQRIIVLGENGLLEAMTTATAWERYDARAEDWVRTDAPTKVVKAYRDRAGHWRLPVLAGIVNAPTLRADGTLLTTPGYDAATGLLFDPQGVTFPQMTDRPAKTDAAAALEILTDLISTFPFVSTADRSVALSAILTAVVRPAIPSAPMHAFTAPIAGSGKSMLVDICSMIVSGREAGVIGHGKSEAEFEKRLASLLLAGDVVFAIDNIEEPLSSEFLCQVLTQPVVRARILGKSQAPELPSNGFITATGNNLIIVGDLTRRTLMCRLDPENERPETRVFNQDPITMVRENRGKYLAAALTVLRAYRVADRPMKTNPLGSFVPWSQWVREALLWLGEADPVSTMERVRETDPKRSAIVAVTAQWADVIGPEVVTAKTVIERATASTRDHMDRPTYTNPDFREALMGVAGAAGHVNSTKLAYWLRAHKDRVVDKRKIILDGTTGGVARWKLGTV